MRDGTPLLPDLAGALHRHLQELPSPANGLGLTQRLLLQALAAGREGLDGRRNWLDIVQVERWVGGVRIAAGQRNWHWDDTGKALILI